MSNEREKQMMDAADRYADEVFDESSTGAQVAETINDFCAGWRAADSSNQWLERACEWLRENIYHRVYECGDRLGYPTADFLKDFRKAMEG